MVTALLQGWFFKGLQSSPRSIWIKRCASQGILETFKIARDGKQLSVCVLSPSDDQLTCQCDSSSVVVLAHPLSKKAKYFFTETERAKAYLTCGATVVFFDFNGFGESEAIDLFYWKDARAVVEWVEQRFVNKRVVLHGASFGAFHIIRAAEYLPQNATLILENVNRSLMSYWKRWPSARALVAVLEILRLPFVRDMKVDKVFKEFSRGDIRIEFLACENDTYTTAEEMQVLYRSVNSPNKYFTLFHNASHLNAIRQDRKLYSSVIKRGGVCHAQ